MAYSPQLMTFIFIKPDREREATRDRLVLPETLRKRADTWFDVQRLDFDVRAVEARRPANTCVSTPSLCNANFARS
jgi:hypothetical protein